MKFYIYKIRIDGIIKDLLITFSYRPKLGQSAAGDDKNVKSIIPSNFQFLP